MRPLLVSVPLLTKHPPHPGPCLCAQLDLRPLFCSMGLVPSFAGYLALDHPNNRVCNIHICRLLVEADVLGEQELHHHQIAEKVAMPASFGVPQTMQTKSKEEQGG